MTFVYKYSDTHSLFVHVGLLAENEVVFLPPKNPVRSNINHYVNEFFVRNELYQEDNISPRMFDNISPKLYNAREITTVVDDDTYTLGFIDEYERAIFYDQYLK